MAFARILGRNAIHLHVYDLEESREICCVCFRTLEVWNFSLSLHCYCFGGTAEADRYIMKKKIENAKKKSNPDKGTT